MKWSREAEHAVSKVPFFVRKRVRKRVEETAARAGAREVRMEHVRASQRAFLERMEEEVKGHQVETCFGPAGCPNRAVMEEDVAGSLEKRLASRKLRGFLKTRVKGSLKMHHEFRVSVSDCPNSCSRPQIADVGLIGARRPAVSEEHCTLCESCVEVCREDAISLGDGAPMVDEERCLGCGQCIGVCPTGTLQQSERGYRVLVGGKLGRHPRLATELPGVYPLEEALDVLDGCLDLYLCRCERGERFGEIVERVGAEAIRIPVREKK